MGITAIFSTQVSAIAILLQEMEENWSLQNQNMGNFAPFAFYAYLLSMKIEIVIPDCYKIPPVSINGIDL